MSVETILEATHEYLCWRMISKKSLMLISPHSIVDQFLPSNRSARVRIYDDDAFI